MKIYCQQCGQVLEGGIKICPKCGFENKVVGKNKWLKITFVLLIIFLIFGGTAFFFKERVSLFYLTIFNKNTAKESQNTATDTLKEDAVLKNFYDIRRMQEVGLCKEAYDKYITTGSRDRKGYGGYQPACEYQGKNWKNYNIIDVYILNDTRADVKYGVDVMTEDFDSCREMKTWDSLNACAANIPKIPKYKEWVETWLYEDGMWKRDY